jgi:hypothetical protein
MSARRCGHVQRQDIRIGQELVEARVGETEPGGCRLVPLEIASNHIHAEAAGDFDHAIPDATGTDDTDHSKPRSPACVNRPHRVRSHDLDTSTSDSGADMNECGDRLVRQSV